MADNTILYGKWLYNEVIDAESCPNTYVDISFILNETTIYNINQIYYGSSGLIYRLTINGTTYYMYPYNNTWAEEGYRTILVTSGGSDALLTWLQANATKLSDSLDIDDLKTNKMLFTEYMDELTDIINDRANTSGTKTIAQLVETANEIIKPSGSIEFTQNGTYDVTEYAEAIVNTPAPSGTININTSGTYDVTEYAEAVVELVEPSGTYEVVENGTYNIKDYEFVEVNTPVPSGTLDITYNGSFNVEQYAEVNVNVEGASGSTLKNLLDYTKSMEYMFYDNTTITDLTDYISFSDTSNVTNMYYTFYGCEKLTTIPLFDTSNVTSMVGMFYGCEKLTTIPLFDTSNVTTMRYMFYGCENLTEIPLFDTSNVTNMENMFYGCEKLTTIPLFDTSNVTSIYYMLYECTSLTELPQLDTSKVTNMQYTFYRCYVLTTIDLTYYKISSTSNSKYIFYNCCSLKQIIIRGFGSNYAINSNAFNNCYHLTGTVSATYNPNGDKDCYIYVPSAMVDTLKSATTWSLYADQIRALEDYTVDGTTTGELDESKI